MIGEADSELPKFSFTQESLALEPPGRTVSAR
jgi:hypothetical protein